MPDLEINNKMSNTIRIFKKQFIVLVLMVAFNVAVAEGQDWKVLANNLIENYRGKIISVEQLNSSTCWIVVSKQVSIIQCVKMAENVGYFIRNSTGGINGIKPSVHIFKQGKHIAIARPDGLNFKGKLDIQNWSAEAFEGKYRP